MDKLSKEKSLIFEREQINNFFLNIKNPKIALYFIEEIPRILNIKVDINAIFFYAVINEYTEIVQILFLKYKNKININIIKDSKGLTPLHYAAAKGHIKIVNLLLSKQNIKINEKDFKRKYISLYYAAFYGHVEIFNLLLSKIGLENVKEDYKLLPYEAILNGGKEIVQELPKKPNVDINTKNGTIFKDTPLDVAVRKKI